MAWEIRFHDEFDPEFDLLPREVQIAALIHLKVLARLGPQMGRPRVDTLTGSKYANMKELRFDADGGVWRVAFAFDPTRRAIVLVAGDKSGVSQTRFYKGLIRKADQRFDRYLKSTVGD